MMIKYLLDAMFGRIKKQFRKKKVLGKLDKRNLVEINKNYQFV